MQAYNNEYNYSIFTIYIIYYIIYIMLVMHIVLHRPGFNPTIVATLVDKNAR